MDLRVGDIVGRKSYNMDVHFRVIGIDQKLQIAELKGIDMRLWADAPMNDLVKIEDDTRGKWREKEEQQTSSSIKEIKQLREQGDSFFKLPGRVLHIDGDSNYLKRCLNLYRELNIPAYGIHLAEAEMPHRVLPLLRKVRPDILVLTGHDAYIRHKGSKDDIHAYRHSTYYKEAVMRAREYDKNRDSLIIFSGACQSHFEELIQAGSNFASSPERINIHSLDPVYIVEKACYTPISHLINITEIFQYSMSGSAGLGGIDTRGTLRIGKPRTE